MIFTKLLARAFQNLLTRFFRPSIRLQADQPNQQSLPVQLTRKLTGQSLDLGRNRADLTGRIDTAQPVLPIERFR